MLGVDLSVYLKMKSRVGLISPFARSRPSAQQGIKYGFLSRICGVILVPGVVPSCDIIEGKFHGLEGTKAVGSSGNDSDFVVEALNGTIGDFSFGRSEERRVGKECRS